MVLCDLRVTRGPSPRHETRQYFQTMINAQSAGHHGEVERFQLRRGEMYRISYTVRTPQQRRVTRSLAVYEGSSKRRLWDGREAVAANEVTERYARACEVDVLATPADWLWSYRRWRLKKPLYGGGA